MITLKKLESLPRKTRLRKIITLFQEQEYLSHAGKQADIGYAAGLVRLVLEEKHLPGWYAEYCKTSLEVLEYPDRSSGEIVRTLSGLRHGLMRHLGAEPADWDLLDFSTGGLDGDHRTVLPFEIYLEDVRSPFNVGSIFRTAESFGARKIVLSPSTPTPDHPRVRRTAMGCTEIVEWERRELDYLDGRSGVFALELGGKTLEDFVFPPEGIMIVGSEELGVSPEGLAAAEGGAGRVSIPLLGAKGSLNVSVAFGIIMHAWAVRTGRLSHDRER
jgi:TrmH family RNA methyltransferase